MQTPLYELDRWHARAWTKGSRYYRASVQQDLFGNWQLHRSWGSLRWRGGQALVEPARDSEEALELLERTARRRQQRGYEERETP